jgi:Arm domain-containing DNA-binding protein
VRARISKRIVDSAVPEPDRDLWIWDADVRGFGLRVRPTGHRVYVVEYRAGTGGRASPKRRVTIGRHGSPWTPNAARREAERILGLVAAGADPAASKAALRGAPTVGDLVARYMAEHVTPRRKAGTAGLYHGLADRFIVPALAGRRSPR